MELEDRSSFDIDQFNNGYNEIFNGVKKIKHLFLEIKNEEDNQHILILLEKILNQLTLVTNEIYAYLIKNINTSKTISIDK